MEESPIATEERGTVLHVILTRAAKHNALNLAMLDGLRAATDSLRERDDLRVLLISAEGRYFSAGADLHSPLAPDPALTSPSSFRRWYRQGRGSLHGLGDEWEAIEKPVVVLFEGPCLGGALELSMCADFRLATPAARFGLPEILLGALPGSGGTSRLVRLAGPHWARWLVLANRQIDAERALAIGLVHDILPPDNAADQALDFCRTLAALPPEAFAAGKLAIELAADLERQQARTVERLAVSSLIGGSEYRTMIAAMRAKLRQK